MEASFVAILFAELLGTAALYDRAGDDAADAVRRSHFSVLREAVTRHGGCEVSLAGDDLMVAFGSAVGAVRCAIEMQQATAAQAQGLALRVGLDAGEPLLGGDDLYGTPVIVARRLCDAADAGEIIASEAIRHIAGSRNVDVLHPAGALRLPGIGEPVAVARVRWGSDDDAERTPPLVATEPGRPVTVALADDQRPTSAAPTRSDFGSTCSSGSSSFPSRRSASTPTMSTASVPLTSSSTPLSSQSGWD